MFSVKRSLDNALVQYVGRVVCGALPYVYSSCQDMGSDCSSHFLKNHSSWIILIPRNFHKDNKSGPMRHKSYRWLCDWLLGYLHFQESVPNHSLVWLNCVSGCVLCRVLPLVICREGSGAEFWSSNDLRIHGSLEASPRSILVEEKLVGVEALTQQLSGANPTCMVITKYLVNIWSQYSISWTQGGTFTMVEDFLTHPCPSHQLVDFPFPDLSKYWNLFTMDIFWGALADWRKSQDIPGKTKLSSF